VLAGLEALRRRRLRALWPVVAVVLLVMAEAWIRRGSPVDTGYGDDHGYATVLPYSGRPGFSLPFVFGVLSILFSFGRGLVFFMPGLLFALRGRRAALLDRGPWTTVVALLLFTLGFVAFYAKWWAWYGGASFGPRFFLIAALPAAILLAPRLVRPSGSVYGNIATLLVLALSTWVAVIGVLTSARPPDVCVRDLFAYEPLCWYSPELSPLGYPYVSFPHVHVAAGLVAALCIAVAVYLAAPTVRALSAGARGLRPRAALSGWRV
jgi:hypothetical protein